MAKPKYDIIKMGAEPEYHGLTVMQSEAMLRLLTLDWLNNRKLENIITNNSGDKILNIGAMANNGLTSNEFKCKLQSALREFNIEVTDLKAEEDKLRARVYYANELDRYVRIDVHLK